MVPFPAITTVAPVSAAVIAAENPADPAPTTNKSGLVSFIKWNPGNKHLFAIQCWRLVLTRFALISVKQKL
jgi:hypothetical protein